jgi:hypothetical protein
MRLPVVARRVLPVIVTTVGFSGGAVAYAAPASVSLCVPSTPNKAVNSASSTGTCASGSAAVALPTSHAEQQTLISILPDISFQSSGIGGKPTIQFSGVNLQLINGSGSETTLNGEGNLVIGYNPAPGIQTGSHNLLLGIGDQADLSYGGINAGLHNTINGPGASVLGGNENTASGLQSTVTGGALNTASGQDSSVSGGAENGASGIDSSISGGSVNTASGFESSSTGGSENLASGTLSAASNTVRQGIQLNFSNWSDNAGFGSGGPEWYTDGSGVVHLEGAVSQFSSGGNANLIGTLPPAARPSRTVYTIVHTLAGTYADLSIGSDGSINLLPSSNTNPAFVSLEGISYRQ